MLQDIEEREEIIQRVAALDIGKAELVCCTRVPRPDRAGQRMQEVTTHSTMTRSLQVIELPLESWRVPYAASSWITTIFSYSSGDFNAAEL